MKLPSSARPQLAGLCVLLCLAAPAPATPHDGHHHHGSSTGLRVAEQAGSRGAQLAARIASNSGDSLALSVLARESLRLAKQSGTHGHYQLAEEAFRKWHRIEPSNPSASLGLGYALLGQHRFREALTFARRSAASSPREPQVWALLGDLHFALGNYVEAEFAFRALEHEGLNLFHLARLAQSRQQAGEIEQARGLYLDALEAGRLLEEPATALAWVHSMLGTLDLEAGELVQAEAQFNRALDLDPGMHAARHGIAQVEISEGHLDHALPTLRDLVEQHGLPRYTIALARVEGGEFGEQRLGAVQQSLLEEALAGEIGHLRELAELLLERSEDLERALEFAQRDLDQVRQDSGAFETLAWAHHHLGNHGEALRHIRRALEPGPSSVRLLLRAAVISGKNGMELQRQQLLDLACERDVLLRAELEDASRMDLTGPRAQWALRRTD